MSRGCLVHDELINYCSKITYNTAQKTYVFMRSHDEQVDNDVCCFYDGYPIRGKSVGLPKSFNGDKFKVWGHFCSFECARSFVHDNSISCNQGKETSLLALMAVKTFGIHFRLNRAPNKFLLKFLEVR